MALDISIMKIIILIIQITTLILLFGLLNIYRKSYKEIKIGYTIGLIIFALLLIMKNIVQLSISVFLIYTGNHSFDILTQDNDLFPTIIELIAVGVLYKITKDY